MTAGGIMIFAIIVGYLVPTIIASARGVKSAGPVLVNLFLGWTLFGWLLAFVWACVARTEKQDKLDALRHAELLAALTQAKPKESSLDRVIDQRERAGRWLTPKGHR